MELEHGFTTRREWEEYLKKIFCTDKGIRRNQLFSDGEGARTMAG